MNAMVPCREADQTRITFRSALRLEWLKALHGNRLSPYRMPSSDTAEWLSPASASAAGPKSAKPHWKPRNAALVPSRGKSKDDGNEGKLQTGDHEIGSRAGGDQHQPNQGDGDDSQPVEGDGNPGRQFVPDRGIRARLPGEQNVPVVAAWRGCCVAPQGFYRRRIIRPVRNRSKVGGVPIQKL